MRVLPCLVLVGAVARAHAPDPRGECTTTTTVTSVTKCAQPPMVLIVRHKISGPAIAAFALFGATTLGLMIGGPASGSPLAAIPAAGPIMSAVLVGNNAKAVGYAIGGALQVVTLIAAIAAAKRGPEYRERKPVELFVAPDGVGLSF